MRKVIATGRLMLAGLLGALFFVGCSPDQILGSNELPPDVSDPGLAKTPNGALASYRGAVVDFALALGGSSGGVILPMALITDELQSSNVGRQGVSGGSLMLADARTLPELTDPSLEPSGSYIGAYSELQKTRGQIQEASGALATYAPNASPALRGRLFTLEGFTEVFLADLFCSGIPMSTVDFEGDYTYQSGSTTKDVYQRATSHFDSAFALSADSADVMNLARVGKARALLALGEYDAAGSAVAAVPDGFRYTIQYSGNNPNFAALLPNQVENGSIAEGGTMTDREGANGLPYLSSQDLRVVAVLLGNNLYGVAHNVPAKYSTIGDSPIVLADGVEARLIEAEVRLHAGDANWLAVLNALRTDGTYDTQPNQSDPAATDTMWHAGSGGVAGLEPLNDPGTSDARIDLVFQERGYWLFLTGHRQGDLRRLVREYGRISTQVYPNGAYAGLNGRYGSDVTAPIPAAERLFNPKFTGCTNRGA